MTIQGAITGFVAGDTFGVNRTITGIPTGRTITKAWLTVKTLATDADPGLVQKIITGSFVSGTGQITDDGATDGIGALAFILNATDTTTLGPGRTYVYDIQLKFDDGTIGTLEIGTLSLLQGVTAAVS